MCSLKFGLQTILLSASVSVVLSGCMVGPDFHSPASPKVRTFTHTPLPAQTAKTPGLGKAGKAQRFQLGKDIPEQWWTLFHSPEMNQLIRHGLAHSPNLAAAYATLRQAQETLYAQIGNSLFPAVNAAFSGERQRFSPASLGAARPTNDVFNLFNASVNISYTLDIFGGLRRQIEALGAQVDYQQFQLIAAQLTLTSNIVTTAVSVASTREQLLATHALLKAQEQQLAIIKKQFFLGGVSRADVLTQETLVGQTRAKVPPLEKSLSQFKHALLVLVGEFPNQSLPAIHLNRIDLPRSLPVSLPSNLVRQRPDVRASQALLHAASAQIGVATSNLLPQFTITGMGGWESLTLSNLIASNSKIWSLTAGITQPVFHGGALLAQRRAAIAAYDQAAAQYKQTVLQGFQNVADTLRALETDARALRAQRQAENAADRNLQLTTTQYRLGGVSYLTLLNAQQQYQQIKINRIQAQAARYSDTAALFQALGGGWWNKEWCVKECLIEKGEAV